MTRWRTGNNRRKSARIMCRTIGHAPDFGYGLAYGGIGTYEFCTRCGALINKWLDEADDE